MKYCVLLLSLLTAACHRVSYYKPISMEGVEFIAHSGLIGPSSDSVGVWVSMRNTTPYPHQIRSGACPPSAQFSTARGVKNEIVHKWDYVAMRTAIAKKHGTAYGCILVLMISFIPPGHETTYKAFTIAAKDVLGDSLPPRRYAVTLLLPIEGIGPLPAGVVDLGSAPSKLTP